MVEYSAIFDIVNLPQVSTPPALSFYPISIVYTLSRLKYFNTTKLKCTNCVIH